MRFLFLLLFSFPLFVHASVPYTNNLTGPDVYYASLKKACVQMIPAAESNFASSGSGLTIKLTYSHGACIYSFKRSDGYSGKSASTIPSGETASASAAERCSQGKSDTVTWPFGMRDPATGEVPQSSAILPPWPLCSAGCSVESSSPPVNSCFSFPDDGNPHQVYCEWNAKQTGSTCSTGDSPVPPTLPPCPPGYSSGESGCTKDDTSGGDTGGGDTGGGDTGGGDTGGGDTGGGDTGGGDTGGGDTGGGDTGGGDTGGGDTGGGDTGGGDTGGGDTGGGDGTGEAIAYGTDCGVAFSCSGDPVGCAIARITKDQSCRLKEGSDLDLQKDELNHFLSDPLFSKQDDEEINLSDFFDNTTRFLPSSCPPDETAHLQTNGGSVVEFSYAPLCALAIDLSYLLVSAAGIFFIWFVSKADGS